MAYIFLWFEQKRWWWLFRGRIAISRFFASILSKKVGRSSVVKSTINRFGLSHTLPLLIKVKRSGLIFYAKMSTNNNKYWKIKQVLRNKRIGQSDTSLFVGFADPTPPRLRSTVSDRVISITLGSRFVPFQSELPTTNITTTILLGSYVERL